MPMVFDANEQKPVAVLLIPVVFAARELAPEAVLFVPVFTNNALQPRAALVVSVTPSTMPKDVGVAGLSPSANRVQAVALARYQSPTYAAVAAPPGGVYALEATVTITKCSLVVAEAAGRTAPTVKPARVPSGVTVARKPVEALSVPARVKLLEMSNASISVCSTLPWLAVRACVVEVLVTESLSWTTPLVVVLASATLIVPDVTLMLVPTWTAP